MVKKNIHIKNTLAGIGILSVCYVSCSQEIQQPNILFIMSDDHTTQAIEAYGGRLARLNPTPNIDQLANQGGCCFKMRFAITQFVRPAEPAL